MVHNKNNIIVSILLNSTLMLSGCQLVNESAHGQQSYGEYYLTLQQLSTVQLTEEVEKLQKKTSNESTASLQDDYDTQVKLLLLYSLPKSPIYNSFNAKALLNRMKSEGNNAALATITPSEQAFINSLSDQLNQRLLMRNRLLAQQEKQQKQAQVQQKQLKNKIQQLEQTIIQLKKIEQAIDKREQ